MNALHGSEPEGIAVIGMACRFPGARTPAEFWQNLQEGRESITVFSDDELRAEGVPAELIGAPDYVKAAPVLDDVDKFDAAFFHYSPREAAAIDPQQRFFLECAWEALEDAGYDPLGVPDRVGVYAGALVNSYLLHHLAAGRMSLSPDSPDFLETLIASDKDFLATRTSYKLNLKGPSLTVQTACSTGLVAVHLACQSLLNGECEMALAGAASIRVPHRRGYVFRPGGMISPDGHCRPFSDRAQGTVFGSGVGIVVLKRLADALADRNAILAVIRGTAVNNDGSGKLSYTAPGIDGHADVVAEALAMAGVDAATIGYVEAHGTATELGDPVEVAALTRAFRSMTRQTQFCALGSVKGNIGHIDAAAGIAGLIKTVLMLKHGRIPATLHFERPNPKLDLAESPFFVAATNRDWRTGGAPRRAGVSSLGVGGTNAHVVLEQAPNRDSGTRGAPADRAHLLVLSARTPADLAAQAARYVGFLRRTDAPPFDAVCHTAALGRHAFPHRLAVVARDAAEAADQLARPVIGRGHGEAPGVAFLFSGQGSQYPGMTRRLYDTYPVVRASLDAAQDHARAWLDRPLLEVIFSAADEEGTEAALDQTAYVQPAVVAVDLAIYDLWRSWGIQPAAVMGHSLGEYAAAAAAGVIPREDLYRFICERGRLMQDLAGEGAMAAVHAPADWVAAFARATAGVEVAARNAPDEVVIAGPRPLILDALQQIRAQGLGCTLLPVAKAFHSAMIEPVLDRLTLAAARMRLSAPTLPIISNVTGRFDGREMATPSYWRDHARRPVECAEGMQTLLRAGCRLFVECGPGSVLIGLGLRSLPQDQGLEWLASIRRKQAEDRTILDSLGRLYAGGVSVDWPAVCGDRRARRVSLPTYPFQRTRHWMSEEGAADGAAAVPWLYEVAWQRDEAVKRSSSKTGRVIIIAERTSLAAQLRDAFDAQGLAADILPPASALSFATQMIAADAATLTAIIDLSGLAIADPGDADRRIAEAARRAEALAGAGGTVRLWFVTRLSQAAGGAPSAEGLAQAPLWGLARTLGVERPDIWGGIVDLGEPGADEAARLADAILAPAGPQVCLRGAARLTCQLRPARLSPARKPVVIDPQGSYLITGGTGGLGPAVAAWLIDRGARHLVLTSRSGRVPEAIAALRQTCADLRVEQVDVCDPTGMQRLVDGMAAKGRPLRGVLHLAGALRHEAVDALTDAAVSETLRAKALGAWTLHRITQGLELDFLVLFSSLSALLPAAQMGAYAAANAFLDSLAQHRRGLGLSALSVNWGPWAGPGMGAAHAASSAGSGVALLDPGRALSCLDSLLNADPAQAVVADVDWPVFRQLWGAGQNGLILDGLCPPGPEDAPQDGPQGVSPVDLLRAAPAFQRPHLLEHYVRSQVEDVLGIDPRVGIDAGKRLFELGLDSLGGIRLRNRLQADLGHVLPATLTFNYPTVEAIAAYLADTLPALQPARPQEAPEAAPAAAAFARSAEGRAR